MGSPGKDGGQERPASWGREKVAGKRFQADFEILGPPPLNERRRSCVEPSIPVFSFYAARLISSDSDWKKEFWGMKYKI